MAKKSSVVKEKKRERMVALKREKRTALKKKVMDLTISPEERQAAVIELNKMPRNSSRIRLRNRCQLTGRSRGFLRKFKLSRLCFREMASNGLIPGVTKASWSWVHVHGSLSPDKIDLPPRLHRLAPRP